MGYGIRYDPKNQANKPLMTSSQESVDSLASIEDLFSDSDSEDGVFLRGIHEEISATPSPQIPQQVNINPHCNTDNISRLREALRSSSDNAIHTSNENRATAEFTKNLNRASQPVLQSTPEITKKNPEMFHRNITSAAGSLHGEQTNVNSDGAKNIEQRSEANATPVASISKPIGFQNPPQNLANVRTVEAGLHGALRNDNVARQFVPPEAMAGASERTNPNSDANNALGESYSGLGAATEMYTADSLTNNYSNINNVPGMSETAQGNRNMEAITQTHELTNSNSSSFGQSSVDSQTFLAPVNGQENVAAEVGQDVVISGDDVGQFVMVNGELKFINPTTGFEINLPEGVHIIPENFIPPPGSFEIPMQEDGSFIFPDGTQFIPVHVEPAPNL